MPPGCEPAGVVGPVWPYETQLEVEVSVLFHTLPAEIFVVAEVKLVPGTGVDSPTRNVIAVLSFPMFDCPVP